MGITDWIDNRMRMVDDEGYSTADKLFRKIVLLFGAVCFTLECWIFQNWKPPFVLGLGSAVFLAAIIVAIPPWPTYRWKPFKSPALPPELRDDLSNLGSMPANQQMGLKKSHELFEEYKFLSVQFQDFVTVETSSIRNYFGVYDGEWKVSDLLDLIRSKRMLLYKTADSRYDVFKEEFKMVDKLISNYIGRKIFGKQWYNHKPIDVKGEEVEEDMQKIAVLLVALDCTIRKYSI